MKIHGLAYGSRTLKTKPAKPARIQRLRWWSLLRIAVTCFFSWDLVCSTHKIYAQMYIYIHICLFSGMFLMRSQRTQEFIYTPHENMNREMGQKERQKPHTLEWMYRLGGSSLVSRWTYGVLQKDRPKTTTTSLGTIDRQTENVATCWPLASQWIYSLKTESALRSFGHLLRLQFPTNTQTIQLHSHTVKQRLST